MKVVVLTMAALLLMGATGIQASNDNSIDTTRAKLSREFSTVDEAAKAIWTSSGRKDVCSTYVDGPIPGNPTNFFRVSFFTPDYKLQHGLAGTIVVDGDHFRVAIGGAEPSQEFSTVDEAAKAIWAAEGKRGDCTTYVLGPISGEGCYYRVYFLSPDQQSFYGTATIIAEGKYFHIPTLGGYFFHRSGKAEGTFDPRLFDKTEVLKYLADRYPEIGPVQKIWLMHPGVSRFEWLWEVATPSQTYYLHVADTKGTARLVTKAELEEARAADVVKVDSIITDGEK